MVVAKNASGQFYLWSGGSNWRLMPWNYSAAVWSFVSNSHDLVLSNVALSDTRQAGLLLFRQVEGPNAPAVSLTGAGVHPDSLAMTSDGENVIAAASANGTVWSIELKTGTVRLASAQQGEAPLLTLRDGHTFFLSVGADASFSLLNVASASAKPAVLVHPGTLAAIAEGGAK